MPTSTFLSLPLLLAAATIGLTGCVLGPDYARPDLETGTAYQNAGRTTPAPPEGDWWKSFDDPALDRLMRDLERDNPTLAGALARYDAARSALGIAKADHHPAVFGDVLYRREHSSDSGTFVPDSATNSQFEAALNLNYEVDLWGRVRRSVEAARGDLAAAQADAAAARLSLKGELARTWFQLRYNDEELALVEGAAKLRGEGRDLFAARVRGGESDNLELAQVTTEYERARAQALALRRLRAELVNALAALTGVPPSRFDLPKSGSLRASPKIPAGVPSLLLARRPDVAADEARLAAATARIGVVKASYLPRLNLGGRGGLSSLKASDFLQPSSLFGEIGPDLELPGYQGKRRSSDLARSEALAREALAKYRETVLQAIRETEDALAAIAWLDREIGAHRKAADSADEASRLARHRYQAGLVSFLDVIDSERTRLTERRNLTQAQLARHLAAVRLVQALGGGWKAP